MKKNGRHAGFTLMELMIAVAILAILTVIAVPTYLDSVIKSNRRAAQGFVMDVSLRQNQVLLDRRSYASTLADLGMALPAEVAKAYTVSITATAGPPPSYTITATPKVGTAQVKDGALTLSSAGVKTPAEKW